MPCEFQEPDHVVKEVVCGKYNDGSGKGYRLVRCNSISVSSPPPFREWPDLDYFRIELLSEQGELEGTYFISYHACFPKQNDEKTEADVDEAWCLLVANPRVSDALKVMPYDTVQYPNGLAYTSQGHAIMR